MIAFLSSLLAHFGTTATIIAVFFGPFAHADSAPVIVSAIKNTQEQTITSAPIGTIVHNVAQIASSTSQAVPTGTVDFRMYANTSCSGSPVSTQTGVALVNGVATSSNTTLGANGISYVVHYNGDQNNIPTDSECKAVTATSNTSSINATLSTTTPVVPGTSVHESSTLSGVAANAGGTVTYTVFTNSSCTTQLQGAGVKTVTNGIVPDSDNVVFNNAGSYYWQAVYSGDQNNSAATSTCGTLTVQAPQAPGKNSPTLPLTLSSSSVKTGTSVYSGASLSGATGSASGTVAYKVFTDNACTTLYTNAGVKTVTNASVPNSDPVTFNTPGTYYWQAVYSGDANNNSATSTCANGVLTVSNNPVPQNGTGAISGQVFNDKNDNGIQDSGETGLAGFKVHLYNVANFNNFKYSPVYKTATTDANGNYSFGNLPAGTYSVEQVLKKGWKQTSTDYVSVSVTNGSSQTGYNFGDVVGPKKKETGHGTEKSHHGSGKSGKGKGNHFGWFFFGRSSFSGKDD